MIQQLSVFLSEVTRVAGGVGTEGELGGQAKVKGVSGVWKDLTESVNQMAGNLTAQVRNIADVTIAVANGDYRKRLPSTCMARFCDSKKPSTRWSISSGHLHRKSRVAREVGTDGRLGGQAVVPGVSGTWKDLPDAVNAMATSCRAGPNIATVTTAVAHGDLLARSQWMSRVRFWN